MMNNELIKHYDGQYYGIMMNNEVIENDYGQYYST